MRTSGWRIIRKKIIAVTDATFAVAKRKPEKRSNLKKLKKTVRNTVKNGQSWCWAVIYRKRSAFTCNFTCHNGRSHITDWDCFKEFIQGFSDEIVIENLFPGKKVKMKMMLNHSSKPLKANCTLESTNSFHLNCYKEKFVSMDRCRSQKIDQEKK